MLHFMKQDVDVGSVVLSNDIAIKRCFSKTRTLPFKLVASTGANTIFHNITARGKYSLDSYDIMAFNQNLY